MSGCGCGADWGVVESEAFFDLLIAEFAVVLRSKEFCKAPHDSDMRWKQLMMRLRFEGNLVCYKAATWES